MKILLKVLPQVVSDLRRCWLFLLNAHPVVQVELDGGTQDRLIRCVVMPSFDFCADEESIVWVFFPKGNFYGAWLFLFILLDLPTSLRLLQFTAMKALKLELVRAIGQF